MKPILALLIALLLAPCTARADLPPLQPPAARLARAIDLEQQGYPDRAAEVLQLLLPVARSRGELPLLIDVLNRLGALRLHEPEIVITNGNLRKLLGPPESLSRAYLNEALALAEKGGDPARAASVHNNLGTFHLLHRELKEARQQFDAGLRLSRQGGTLHVTTAILANQARLSLATGDRAGARHALDEALATSERLPAERGTAVILLGIGQLYRSAAGPEQGELLEKSRQTLEKALAAADALNDRRLVSAACCALSETALARRQYEPALDMARRALFVAQTANDQALLFLAQRQLGAIQAAVGHDHEALAAYRAAVASLQGIRSCVSPESGRAAFPYRETVEPVTLEFVSLLLKASDSAATRDEQQRLLAEVQEVVEGLRSAELQEYLKDGCAGVPDRPATDVSRGMAATALVYFITLPDRLEILATLPAGISRFTTRIEATVLRAEADKFIDLLSNDKKGYSETAKRLYDLVIRPLEPELRRAGIEHLVLIPDSTLRGLPLAALHDGKKFLIESFTCSTNQGMKLVPWAPPVSRGIGSLLAAGITESRFGFNALPGVEHELSDLHKIVGGTTLLNAGFTITALKTELAQQPYAYVHLATHGEFAGDMRNMFLLSYESLIRFDDLNRTLKVTKYRSEPLELLTLSACKSAVGDDQASLGLAGIAVKAGARSTVATLWEIEDNPTTRLMVDFYRQLMERGSGKAKALQSAQVNLMKIYQHPYFWAPFILIGNWQ